MIRIVLVALSLVTLAACETVKGAGKDIESAGEAISNTATDAQQNL